jgi:hypothetical protein
LLAAAAQARMVDVFHADVPFKFKVGDRTFRPGRYDLIFVGPGLIAMRDSHAHVVASLTVRPRETGSPAPASKLVFANQKKDRRLTQIWTENRSQVLDVLGEEMVMRPAPSFPADEPPLGGNSLFERRPVLGLKH